MVVELDELARRMLADYDARTPGQRFGETIDLTTLQAYTLQAEIARLRERRGERVIGYKVGCTSRTMQVQLGVNEPIFGRIFDTECQPTGVRLASTRYANLAIEGELAIRLSRDMPGDPRPGQDENAAIASVFPVIELHHYVLPVNGPALAPLIASSGMQAGVVLPARETACSGGVPVISELDVTVDDRVVGTTREPWTMGGPTATLRWLGPAWPSRACNFCRGSSSSPVPHCPFPGATGKPRCRPCPPARDELRRDRLMVPCTSRSFRMPYNDAQVVGFLRQSHDTTLLTDREKHLVGLAVTMTRGCQVCTRNRIEKARAAGLGDDLLNALVNVVSSVNAGVTAATAREGFRMAERGGGATMHGPVRRGQWPGMRPITSRGEPCPCGLPGRGAAARGG